MWMTVTKKPGVPRAPKRAASAWSEKGTNVRFVARLSVLHMELLIIDSMIDAQFLMKS